MSLKSPDGNPGHWCASGVLWWNFLLRTQCVASFNIAVCAIMRPVTLYLHVPGGAALGSTSSLSFLEHQVQGCSKELPSSLLPSIKTDPTTAHHRHHHRHHRDTDSTHLAAAMALVANEHKGHDPWPRGQANRLDEGENCNGSAQYDYSWNLSQG